MKLGLHIDGETINWIYQSKFLGVIIANKLSSKEHISCIIVVGW